MKKSQTEQIEDIQEEHRKILATIENALQKLNSERTHICEQHKEKVQQLNEKLAKLEKEDASGVSILDCRMELLQAKREMYSWNKSNKKTQVDITVKQISALQIQSDAKKTELQEYINHEISEWKDNDYEVIDPFIFSPFHQ